MLHVNGAVAGRCSPGGMAAVQIDRLCLILSTRGKRVTDRKKQVRMLQFRVSVNDVKPEIWRRVLVSSNTTLAGLHRVLQILMGWNDTHLYAFVINKRRYSPATGDDDVTAKRNSIETKLSGIPAANRKFITYEYDFGDSWEVQLCSEPERKGLQAENVAECIEGSRHGPVEDSGGSRGYMEKTKMYGNPQHKSYLDVRKFIGPNFDSEAFDLVQTNEKLKAIV
jgi:hypothetical protein